MSQGFAEYLSAWKLRSNVGTHPHWTVPHAFQDSCDIRAIHLRLRADQDKGRQFALIEAIPICVIGKSDAGYQLGAQ